MSEHVARSESMMMGKESEEHGKEPEGYGQDA